MAIKYHCPKCGRRYMDWGAEKLGFRCPDCESETLVRVGSSPDKREHGPSLRRHSHGASGASTDKEARAASRAKPHVKVKPLAPAKPLAALDDDEDVLVADDESVEEPQELAFEEESRDIDDLGLDSGDDVPGSDEDVPLT